LFKPDVLSGNIPVMMLKQEFDRVVQELGLTQLEMAHLMSTSERTVRRWSDDPSRMPGPPAQALRAWGKLHRAGLAWRPDSVALQIGDNKAIDKYMQHAVDLDALLDRVRARGGPMTSWRVDLSRSRATTDGAQIHFYRLANGSFSPQSYRRTDKGADVERDWIMIEDGIACIAEALGKLGASRSQQT
jgi:hypothetical protein